MSRFMNVEKMVQASEKSWREFSPEELDALWNSAKKAL